MIMRKALSTSGRLRVMIRTRSFFSTTMSWNMPIPPPASLDVDQALALLRILANDSLPPHHLLLRHPPQHIAITLGVSDEAAAFLQAPDDDGCFRLAAPPPPRRGPPRRNLPPTAAMACML